MRRKVLNIWGGGGGGGQGSEYRGKGNGGGGGGRQTFRWLDTDWSPASNQCQLITFLSLKTDNVAKLRIELKKHTFRNTFKQDKIYIY